MQVPILLVLPKGAARPPLESLSDISHVVALVSRAADVGATLKQNPDVRIVVTAATLPDGNWLTVLREIMQSAVPAELVILAKSADTDFRLRATAYGAFDVVEEGAELDEHWDIILQASLHNPFPAKEKRS
jgi:DNA-binding NtrC family response regulator